MKIKHQEVGYANLSGRSLLRQMQNEHTPNLDLFVREAVQNSLDAVQPGAESVIVKLEQGEFVSDRLGIHFEAIGDAIQKNYPGKSKFLSILDMNTVGLTGPLSINSFSDETEGTVRFGNLQKLIYQIAKPQENAGSGGSWGLGKTIYFRIGCGLVIYYSRILNKKTGCYEQRLAATLVEDENRMSLLRGTGSKTGLAWWGVPDPNVTGGTIPLVDSPEIEDILSVFHLSPLQGTETGTRIIIPFIDPETLLRETVTTEEMEDEMRPPWKKSLPAYLRVALQKWYAPRLDNPVYQGPFLKASVDGRQVQRSGFLPFFRLIQDLYNADITGHSEYEGMKISSDPIKLRSVFESGDAGSLAVLKVSASDLGMNPPENQPSPYIDIDRKDAESAHQPILAYVRKPGMIVSYETASEWTSAVGETEENQYIIGVFRSNPSTTFQKVITTPEVKKLEDYLRKSEAADHMRWDDLVLNGQQPGIVRKIRTNIKSRIKKQFKDDSEKDTQKLNMSLGRRLGKKLLPPPGSSYWDRRTGGESGEGGTGGDGFTGPGAGGGSGRSTGTRGFGMVHTGNPVYGQDEVIVPVRLNFGNTAGGELSLLIGTENGRLDSRRWKSKVESSFPLWFKYIMVKGIYCKSEGKTNNLIEGTSIPSQKISRSSSIGPIRFDFFETDREKRASNLEIRLDRADNYTLDLLLCYPVTDFLGILDFHKIRNEVYDR